MVNKFRTALRCTLPYRSRVEGQLQDVDRHRAELDAGELGWRVSHNDLLTDAKRVSGHLGVASSFYETEPATAKSELRDNAYLQVLGVRNQYLAT